LRQSMNSQPLSEWKPGIITRIKLPPYPVLLREEQHQSDTFSSFASACLRLASQLQNAGSRISHVIWREAPDTIFPMSGSAAQEIAAVEVRSSE
jgi:hypothetical protein